MQRVTIEIDGHTVAADVHLTADAAPPVVFFHGVMASLDLAREVFADPTTESWIAVSLPGHAPGRSPAGLAAAAVDAELFAHLAEAALARLLGDRRVIATGWSAGGFAALNLAIHRPLRVAAVASFAGFADGRRVSGAIPWMQWLAGSASGRRALAASMRMSARWPALYGALAGLMTARPGTLSHAWRARMHDEFCRHDPESLVTVLAAVRSLDITRRLGEIGVPTWVVGGADDPVVPRGETERIANGIPGARLTVYPRAGHLFFCEWPALRADFTAWRRSLHPDAQRTEHSLPA